MDRAEAFIQDFLAHYADEYYDPEKAHAYYLRTRELKGRRSGSGLNTAEKKQAFRDASGMITEARRRDLEAAAFQQSDTVAAAHDSADKKRTELSDKFTALFKLLADEIQKKLATITETHADLLTSAQDDLNGRLKKVADQRKAQLTALVDQHTKDAQTIADGVKNQLAALPAIPKGVSKEQRAELVAKRAEDIARIRGDASQKSTALTDQTKKAQDTIIKTTDATRQKALDTFTKAKTEIDATATKGRQTTSADASTKRTTAQNYIKSQQEHFTTELKSSIDTARTRYKALRESLIAQYEEQLTQSYEAIRQG